MKQKTNRNHQRTSLIEIQDDSVIYYISDKDVDGKGTFSFTNSHQKKHTCYVFENVDFRNGISLVSDEYTHIIFRTCRFYEYININSLGEVVFESNSYYADAKYSSFPKIFFNCTSKNLKILNDFIINGMPQGMSEENVFCMNVQTKFLFIDNSTISLNGYNETVSISAKEIILFDSIIEAASISIASADIYTASSTVIGTDSVVINDENNSDINGIESPNIVYNGEKINGKRLSFS